MTLRLPKGRRGTLAAAGLALLTAAGCSQPSSYAMPDQVCGISVGTDALRPLLPSGERLGAEPVDLGGGSSVCKVSVDKKPALYLKADLVPSDTDPVQVRRRELDRYGHPAAIDVGDQGRVADSGALAADHCRRQGEDRKVVVEAHVPGDLSEDVPQRREDLSRFIGTYLPAVQKSLGCAG
ncbi:hypothetical protein [Streptomyces sp. NPDC048577]|uniref:hypothetical protein n=1 Tax=Streptomyces sp. NPDC048577 TaxID=3157209 RepID=UPI0034343D4B